MTEITNRLSTALADRYRLERHLGEGGMATVYLAHDLKHDRKVAIKILKPELSAILGGERFLNEIKVTANLQHPNILPLYDSGEADGFLFYVMPLVEGDTLRDKMDREKQLSVEDTVRIAQAVAGAVDFAHRHDVIHRDLKPENILLQDGQAVVADFGIALAVSQAGGTRLTETGLSMGTPHYMSPEQATGDRELDARSDVYSLGAMTYEMLVGEPPHIGNSVQAIVAKILSERPSPITQTRDMVPVNVDAAVQKALAKSPADRFTSAARFADALENTGYTLPTTSGAAVTAGSRQRGMDLVKVGAVALAAVMTAVAALGWLRSDAAQPVIRVRANLWSYELPAASLRSNAALAPDGSAIVYADSVVGGTQLFRKERDRADGESLAGTEGGWGPFFSPDGQWVGYFEGTRIRKMPSGGGGSITLTSDGNSASPYAAWLEDGTIVYVDGAFNLRAVAADGSGQSTELWDVIGTVTRGANNVAPLPGNRGVLFTGCTAGCVQSEVFLYDMQADSAWVLFEDAMGGWYLPSGHVFYMGIDGGGYMAPFDVAALTVTGGAVPVLEDVRVPDFIMSRSGTALYFRGSSIRNTGELVLVDRDGVETMVAPEWSGTFNFPSLSPDGQTLAISLVESGVEQIWTRRLDRGPASKITFEEGRSFRPTWTPDGEAVAYVAEASGNNISTRRSDGSGQATVVIDLDPGIMEVGFAPDNEWIVFRTQGATSTVHAKRLDDESEPITLFESDYNERQPVVSPDGQWLAYVSDLTGRFEIYVSPFPNTDDGRWTVSTGGGIEPVWSRDGGELFFKSGGMLMVTEVVPGPTFRNDTPQPLFSIASHLSSPFHQFYDVTPDGRFLMIRRLAAAAGDGELILVENWFEELKEMIEND